MIGEIDGQTDRERIGRERKRGEWSERRRKSWQSWVTDWPKRKDVMLDWSRLDVCSLAFAVICHI